MPKIPHQASCHLLVNGLPGPTPTVVLGPMSLLLPQSCGACQALLQWLLEHPHFTDSHPELGRLGNKQHTGRGKVG